MNQVFIDTDSISLGLLDRAIMASTNGVMIVEVTGDEMCVVYVNAAHEKITGYTRNEVVGHPPGMLHRNDPDQEGLTLMRQAIKEQKAITVVLRNYRKDGTFFWNELAISPVKNSAGQVTHFIGILNDVTQQRELDAMKSEFLATAAHELRTPMASVLGYAELLLLRKYDEATRSSYLEIILQQARHVAAMVNELLDLARIEARRGKDFKFAKHDLLQIIEDAASTFVDAKNRIEIVAHEQSVPVNVDREKLHQALLNLIGNALKFSAQEKFITVSLHRRENTSMPTIGVSIRDSGIGMTAEQLARMGERFYRADSSGKIPGTGLGVALSKEIINLHGGVLEASSEWGKGSCLTLWIPSWKPSIASRNA